MKKGLNLVAEQVEIWFRQDSPVYPGSRISRYEFKEGELKGKTFPVRPVTRFKPKGNTEKPYEVHLQWNSGGSILMAMPVDPDNLPEGEYVRFRQTTINDFSTQPVNHQGGMVWRDRDTGAFVFPDESITSRPADNAPLTQVYRNSTVSHLTSDPRFIGALTRRGEGEDMSMVDWMADMSLPFIPVDPNTLSPGVFDEDGRFRRLHEERKIEDFFGLPKLADAREIDERLHQEKKKIYSLLHPDRFSSRTDLTGAHKKRLADTLEHNMRMLESAAYSMQERRFYMNRRNEVAKAAGQKVTERLKQLKANPSCQSSGGKTEDQAEMSDHLDQIEVAEIVGWAKWLKRHRIGRERSRMQIAKILYSATEQAVESTLDESEEWFTRTLGTSLDDERLTARIIEEINKCRLGASRSQS